MNQLESPFRIPTTFPFLSWDIWVFLLGLQNVLLIPLFFFFFCHTTQHVGSLSSLTRDQTLTPALEAQSLNHWTAREVPHSVFGLLFHLFPVGELHILQCSLLPYFVPYHLLSEIFPDLLIENK